jgi:hypothetical protein
MIMRRPDRRTLAQVGYRTLQVLSITVLAVHFALAALFVSPVNPIRIEFRELLDRTVGKYWRQDWRIFAPTPVTTDDAVLVRCLTADEARTGRLPEEGWYDISTPLWKRHQQDRLTAYDRLSRTATYSVRTWATGGFDSDGWYRACTAGAPGACQAWERIVAAARKANEPILIRVGSSFCTEIGRGSETDRVALRLRRTLPPPWSRRLNASPRVDDFELGIFPFDRTIVPSGVFVAGGMR